MESVLSCVEAAPAAVRCSVASSIRLVVVKLKLWMTHFVNWTNPLLRRAATLINVCTKEVTGPIAASLVEAVYGLEQ